ncbi:MAG TPA: DUF2958 domain-containing protein [Thermoanaerobaculia bacterium]|jgi:hypothetical protein|nr:DUF2958 domain-containing protein [Thermoanaerobaculia bacterium]
MKLLTKEVRKALERAALRPVNANANDDALVIVKYFFPAGRYTLYVTQAEFGDYGEGDDALLFGYCISALGPDCDEWGYQSLNELQRTVVKGLRTERDLHFPIGKLTVGEARKNG